MAPGTSPLSEPREVDEVGAAGEVVEGAGRDLEREARLPDTARAGERRQPGQAERRPHRLGLLLAVDEPSRRPRQVRGVQRPQRRELELEALAAELEQPNRRVDVLQPVIAQVDQDLLRAEQVPGRARDDDLTAVGGGGDPRRLMDVEAHVARVALLGLAGVDAHSDSDGRPGPRVRGERALRVGRRTDGAGRGREREEERVALRVDLDSLVGHDGFAQHASMRLEDVAVRRPESPQQGRRPLDVGEEQRDRAGGKAAGRGRGHGFLLSFSPAVSRSTRSVLGSISFWSRPARSRPLSLSSTSAYATFASASKNTFARVPPEVPHDLPERGLERARLVPVTTERIGRTQRDTDPVVRHRSSLDVWRPLDDATAAPRSKRSPDRSAAALDALGRSYFGFFFSGNVTSPMTEPYLLAICCLAVLADACPRTKTVPVASSSNTSSSGSAADAFGIFVQ